LHSAGRAARVEMEMVGGLKVVHRHPWLAHGRSRERRTAAAQSLPPRSRFARDKSRRDRCRWSQIHHDTDEGERRVGKARSQRSMGPWQEKLTVGWFPAPGVGNLSLGDARKVGRGPRGLNFAHGPTKRRHRDGFVTRFVWRDLTDYHRVPDASQLAIEPIRGAHCRLIRTTSDGAEPVTETVFLPPTPPHRPS
jgi:hypothetical protein